MRARNFLVHITGVWLIFIGWLYWSARFDYPIGARITKIFGDTIQTVDPLSKPNLSSACDVFNDRESWILFFLDANYTNDGQPKTYFETSNQASQAMVVEYDSPDLRLTLGLGDAGGDTQVPIRTVRDSQRITIIIAVTRWKTRVLGMSRDSTSPWPNIPEVRWSCELTRIGSDETILSEGFACPGCDVQLRYVTGRGFEVLESILGSLSDVDNSRRRSYIGSFLTAIGFLLMISSYIPRRVRN
jgi:hypothetical protein